MKLLEATYESDLRLPLFNRYLCSDASNLAEVLRTVDAQGAGCWWITLDDHSQALYTSMHAREDDRLELREDIDWDVAGAEAAYERRAYDHRLAQLDASAATWSDVHLPAPVAAIADLVRINAEPDLVVDSTVLLLNPPSATPAAKLAALPNGYFSGDLDTFDNLAVCRRMEEHGWDSFGMGAATLGFRRAEPILDVGPLIADLKSLYPTDGDADDYWSELSATLATATVLLLFYTSAFGETILPPT